MCISLLFGADQILRWIFRPGEGKRGVNKTVPGGYGGVAQDMRGGLGGGDVVGKMRISKRGNRFESQAPK